MRWLTLGLAAVLLVVGTTWAVHQLLPTQAWSSPEALRGALESWGWKAPLLSLALMVLQSVASPIPFALLVLANAAAFGPLQGALLSEAGGVLGALTAYGLGRLGLAPALPEELVERVRSRASFPALVALRMIPGLSLDLVSYGCGMLSVPWGRFLLSTALGLIPRVLVVSFLGDQLWERPEIALVAVVVALLLVAWGRRKQS